MAFDLFQRQILDLNSSPEFHELAFLLISVTVPIKFYQKQQQTNNVFDLFITSVSAQRDCGA